MEVLKQKNENNQPPNKDLDHHNLHQEKDDKIDLNNTGPVEGKIEQDLIERSLIVVLVSLVGLFMSLFISQVSRVKLSGTL